VLRHAQIPEASSQIEPLPVGAFRAVHENRGQSAAEAAGDALSAYKAVEYDEYDQAERSQRGMKPEEEVVSRLVPGLPASRKAARSCFAQEYSPACRVSANRSVEATSNGWPHKTSCSFSAMCGQPLAAPHVER
jgi:hypothetical protein